MSLHLREPAFRIVGMPRHQGLARQEAENRVSEKFELLVVGGRFRVLLVHARLVCKRPPQEFPVFEMMPQNLFECFDPGRDRLVEAMAAWFRFKN